MRLMRAAARALILLAGLSVPAMASDEAPVDPRPVLQASVEKLVELAPNLRTVEVAGFAGRGGHSLCGDALTEALLVALDEEARNPNRVLRDKPLTVRRAGLSATKPDGESVVASGVLEAEQGSKVFMTLAFRRGDAVLAPSGRVAIRIDAFACDPVMRPFLEHVAVGARTSRERLDLSAPVFGVGQRLEVAITINQPMRLFCWVLAEDGTGFVTLPSGNAAAEMKRGLYRYPRDFRLEDIVLSSRFENLFACFGAEQPLPEALEKQWRSLAPAAGKEPTLVDAPAVRAMMEEMRAQPGVSEATARVVVR